MSHLVALLMKDVNTIGINNFHDEKEEHGTF